MPTSSAAGGMGRLGGVGAPAPARGLEVVAAHYSNGVLLLAEAAAGESRTRVCMLSRCAPGPRQRLQAGTSGSCQPGWPCGQLLSVHPSRSSHPAPRNAAPLSPTSSPHPRSDLTIPPVGTATGTHVAVAGLREAVSQLELHLPGEACAIR